MGKVTFDDLTRIKISLWLHANITASFNYTATPLANANANLKYSSLVAEKQRYLWICIVAERSWARSPARCVHHAHGPEPQGHQN